LLFGWVTEGCDVQRWTEAGRAGALSLPRQVWWAEDGSLRSAPVPSVTELRLGQARPADGAAIGPQSEIVAPTAPARLRLRFGETEHAEVVLDAEADTLTIDRTNASADLAASGEAVTAPDAFDAATGRPAARIFVDGSIIEVFTSAGRVLTTRVYPVNPPPWHLETTPDGEVWELAPGT
jgi:beta-fructofuranosidase